ncbi:MAG: hypothetical protein ACI8S6_000384 [Myxococcota bacterium]|jgi:hypothetical protein
MDQTDLLAGHPRLIFGSADSRDLDVIYVVDAIPDTRRARQLCASKQENRNLIVIEGGVVRDCFKGSPDETNNALLRTYALHLQQHPLPVTRPLPRIVPLKAVRAVRIVLSLLSRTPLRPRIKPALTAHDQALRLTVLREIDFTALDFDADVAKSIAFQLGQLRALIGGEECYTKAEVAAAWPSLAGLLGREPGADRAPLNALRDGLLDEMSDVYSRADGDLSIFCYRSSTLSVWSRYALQSRGVIIDLRAEECLCRPYEKFFRLGEVDGWLPEDFAGRQPDEIVEKIDGSLVSLFRHRGELRFASKGSFDNPQVRAAARLVGGGIERLDLEQWDHVFEVVCTENRFPTGFTSVRYEEEGLYLIGLRDRRTGAMAPYDVVAEAARSAGLGFPRRFEGTFDEAAAACAERRWDNTEGWIARFGERRVKLKRAAYLLTSGVLNGLKHNPERILRQHLRRSESDRAAFGDFMPPDLAHHLDTALAPYTSARAQLEAAARAHAEAHFRGDIRAHVALLEETIAPVYRGLLIRAAREQELSAPLHRAAAWTLREAPERLQPGGCDLSAEQLTQGDEGLGR